MSKKMLFLAIITLFASNIFIPAQCGIKERAKKTLNYVKKHPIKSTLIALHGIHAIYNITRSCILHPVNCLASMSNRDNKLLPYISNINHFLDSDALREVRHISHLLMPVTIAYVLSKTN